MEKVLAWIKKHPYETGLIVFGIGIALYLLLASSSSATPTTTATGDTGADLQSAMQLQAAQIQAQVQNNAIQSSAGVQNTQTAAAVSVATLQAQTQQNNDSLSAVTAQFIANLQAGVTNNQTSAQVSINATNTAALQAIALAPYEVEEDQIAANAAGTPAQILQLQNEISTLGANVAEGFSQVGAAFNGSVQGQALQNLTNINNVIASNTGSTLNNIVPQAPGQSIGPAPTPFSTHTV